MTPSAPTALHDEPILVCAYCGAREPMPADAAARDRHLRLRLMQVRRARDSVEAPLATFRAVRTAWLPALLAFAILAAMLWWQLLGGGDTWSSSLAAADRSMQLFAIAGSAAFVGVIVGYVAMSRAFVRWIRPILVARPPIERGLAARCRSCGAELATVRTASVTCAHCGAANLLTAALAVDAGALLVAERAEYERRARGGAAHDPALYAAPSRAFFRGAIVGTVVAGAVGFAVVAVLARG